MFLDKTVCYSPINGENLQFPDRGFLFIGDGLEKGVGKQAGKLFVCIVEKRSKLFTAIGNRPEFIVKAMKPHTWNIGSIHHLPKPLPL